MRTRLLPIIALLASTGAAAQPQVVSPENALASYVARPDPGFQWQEHARFERRGTEVIELRLTSQTWRGIQWRHRLYLIRPESADLTSGNGVVMVAGGRWRPAYASEVDKRLPDGAMLYVRIAEQLQSVVAIIAQVPFQPVFDRTEDELIAHTFGASMPDLAWEFVDTPDGPALCMRSDIVPRNTRIWIAESDSADFRQARWTSRRTRTRGDVHVFTLQRQRADYAAMFGEFEYGPAERYHLTTNVRIVGPDVPGREPHSDAGVCPDRL